MIPMVSLQAVVTEMDVPNDETRAYLNKRTGELVTFGNEELGLAEEEEKIEIKDYPEWQQDMIRKAQEVLDSAEYLPLPSKFDIHEYAIMEHFCLSIGDEKVSEDLLYQIRGSGAFRRFKEAIHRHALVEEWHHFRQAALEEIAREWLEANTIPYKKKG